MNTGAPPVWVSSPPATESFSPPGMESQGEVYQLYDQQINVDSAETYTHVIKEITTENGVQHGANLVFSCDPSYQNLTIHQIVIHRNGQVLNCLDLSKFKIIQQETDLSRQIYNGTVSAVLFLEGVRVGDRIEYSCTVGGMNPVMQGHFSGIYLARYAAPVEQWRLRVLWPDDLALHYKSRGIELSPVIQKHARFTEYTWQQQDVVPVELEEQTPSWYPAFPWIQLSDFQDWAEVVDWSRPLYEQTNALAPELAQRIALIKTAWPDKEQMIREALDFVQKDIRYLGIELGPGSYHPTDAATVLQRRFGDCKDKVVLLCALLKGAGIKAVPVYVSTQLRRSVAELLPAPEDFNHVIVHVFDSDADDLSYWLDPTAEYQSGPITARFLPDYRYGLQITEGESGLTEIPLNDNASPKTVTKEWFKIGGQKQPANLYVQSIYSGEDADYMRAFLALRGKTELAKEYLNDYTERYPGVKSTDLIKIKDEAETDQLEITHNYVISNFWVLDADEQIYRGIFYALGIHSWIMRPAFTLRSTPLELSFPRERKIETQIDLPRIFPTSNFDNCIVGPASSLRVQCVETGPHETIDYDYKTLADYVPASRMAEHLDALAKMENVLNFSLAWQKQDVSSPSARLNWPFVGLAIGYGTILFGGMVWFFRHHSTRSIPPSLEERDPQLSGLGGWLVVLCLNLALGMLKTISSLLNVCRVLSLPSWNAINNVASPFYQPYRGGILIFELLSGIAGLILLGGGMFLFFTKSRMFPRWIMGVIILNFTVSLLDQILVHGLLKSGNASDSTRQTANLMGALVGVVIWIAYLRQSRRVKFTFTR